MATTNTKTAASKTAPATASAPDLNLDGIAFEVEGGIALQSERHYFSAEKSMQPGGEFSYPIRGLLIASELMGEDRPFTALIVRLTAPTIVGTDEGPKRVETGDELIIPATYSLQKYVEWASGPSVAELWMRAKKKTEIKGGKQSLTPWEVKLLGRVARSEALGLDTMFEAGKTAEALPEAIGNAE